MSKRGHHYILTIADFEMRWPKAFPMKYIDTQSIQSICEVLMLFFSRVSLPSYFLSDNGPQFV